MSVFIGHKYGAAYMALAHSNETHVSLRALLQFLSPLIEFGGAGVVVFFLVSGYVITHVLQREPVGVFLMRRFFRIYPLYAAAVLISALASPARPSAAVLLQQLSLFGDFMQTPHALGGVDWTLRIEVLFYLFMAMIKGVGLIDGARAPWLPLVVLLAALGLSVAPRVPGSWSETWCYGYLNLYGPFLLLGVMFRLHDVGRVTRGECAAIAALLLVAHWIALPLVQPQGIQSHFTAAGLAVFVALWQLRASLHIGAFGLLLSELTYPVYLFHNWLYDPLLAAVGRYVSVPGLQHACAVALLFIFCWLTVRLIERPAIRLGQVLSRRVRKQDSNSASPVRHADTSISSPSTQALQNADR